MINMQANKQTNKRANHKHIFHITSTAKGRNMYIIIHVQLSKSIDKNTKYINSTELYTKISVSKKELNYSKIIVKVPIHRNINKFKYM